MKERISMGLDMYLTRNWYIAARFEHRKVQASLKVLVGDDALEIDPKKLSYITEDVAYWRKANQIHGWFVKNVQGGDDDCNEYDVSFDKLKQLCALCDKIISLWERDAAAWNKRNPNEKYQPSDVLKAVIEKELPPQEGFFFGSYEIDEYYFADLVETVEQLKPLKDYSHAHYTYKSSW